MPGQPCLMVHWLSLLADVWLPRGYDILRLQCPRIGFFFRRSSMMSHQVSDLVLDVLWDAFLRAEHTVLANS